MNIYKTLIYLKSYLLEAYYRYINELELEKKQLNLNLNVKIKNKKKRF